MHITLSPEALLTQLNYPINEHTVSQIKKTIANTARFDKFSKHLLSLKDAISHYDGFIALSNSHDYFKIKCEEDSPEALVDQFSKTTRAWADKHKVQLQQVGKKPTYYILGQL